MVVGYRFAPYHILAKLVFNVEAYSKLAQASYVNATFSLGKMSPIEEGRVSITKIRSLGVPNLVGAFQMKLNMTLKTGSTSMITPTKTVGFSGEGEYLIIIPFSLDNVEPGSYQLVIRYSDMFNETWAYWVTRESCLTISP
jgi:hypothetical protein